MTFGRKGFTPNGKIVEGGTKRYVCDENCPYEPMYFWQFSKIYQKLEFWHLWSFFTPNGSLNLYLSIMKSQNNATVFIKQYRRLEKTHLSNLTLKLLIKKKGLFSTHFCGLESSCTKVSFRKVWTSTQNSLKCSQNFIFGEFLKIMKNESALIKNVYQSTPFRPTWSPTAGLLLACPESKCHLGLESKDTHAPSGK